MSVNPKEAALAALFAALTAVGAQIRIPFPLVPLTLQTPFVLAAGLLLGPRGGTLSMTLYLLMGLFGLPVFAGAGGPQVILMPTFGFLLGFIACAGVAGWIAQGGEGGFPSLGRTLAACLGGTGALYLLGLLGLYGNLNLVAGKAVSWGQVIQMGMVPFLLGDGLKILGTSLLVSFSVRRMHRSPKASMPRSAT